MCLWLWHQLPDMIVTMTMFHYPIIVAASRLSFSVCLRTPPSSLTPCVKRACLFVGWIIIWQIHQCSFIYTPSCISQTHPNALTWILTLGGSGINVPVLIQRNWSVLVMIKHIEVLLKSTSEAVWGLSIDLMLNIFACTDHCFLDELNAVCISAHVLTSPSTPLLCH